MVQVAESAVSVSSRALSSKAKGKQRARDTDDEEDYENGVTDGHDVGFDAMELDGPSGSEGDSDTRRRSTAFNGHQLHTPSKSTINNVNGKKRLRTASVASSDAASSDFNPSELGGSVSRSARMRATTTDDEGENGNGHSGNGGYGSESASSDSEMDSDDEAIAAALLESSYTNANRQSRAFVTASRGEAYLHSMARPAKTSAKKLSDIFATEREEDGDEGYSSRHKAFTQKTFLAAVSAARDHSLNPCQEKLDRELERLHDAYAKLFPQWSLELEEGFSIFLYGLGSKIRVMEDFARYLRGRLKRVTGRILIIRGFMSTLGVEDILSALESVICPEISGDFSQQGKSAAKMDERLKRLVGALSAKECRWTAHKPIVLMVHNIDGVALRSFRAQTTLSAIASLPQIRLIASIDHVKAMLLFPSSLACGRQPARAIDADVQKSQTTSSSDARGYNIIYHHVPTFRPYTVETVLSGTLSSIFPPTIYQSDAHLAANALNRAGGGSSESRANAAYFVLASLTQKAKDVFILVAERQVSLAASNSKGDSSNDPERTPAYALLYAALFSLSRGRFLANNVNQLEALLRELRDHSVILASRNPPAGDDGVPDDDIDEAEVGQRAGEYLWIAIDKSDLENLLERLAP